MKKCKVCEKEFTPKKCANKNVKYCSRKCARHAQHYNRLEYNRERSRQWYLKNRDTELEKNREYRKQNKELFHWYHDKSRFDGLRESILKRDNQKCKLCEAKDRLIVHHIDGNGYTNAKKPNNDLGNLVTLCKQCHSALHHWQKANRKLISSEDIVRTLGKPKERHHYGVDRKSFIYGT
jgi:hypothetical protein